MADGWVKLWRKSIDSGIIKNHKVWIFWTYCLMKANHEKNYKCIVGFQEVPLMPGQFVFGLKVASEETGLSIQNIRTCLVFLKKYQNLTIKPTNKFSVITIINWETYQHNDIKTNKQTNTRVTSSQQTSNNIQEHKNIRTKEKEYSANLKEFTSDFISYIKKTNPKKLPTSKNHLESSLNTLKKLTSIDGFDENYIFDVLRWAKKDDFWQDQIYSLAGLRKKNKDGLTKFQNIIISYDKKSKLNPEKKTKEQLLQEYK